jgi:hypothetical protein
MKRTIMCISNMVRRRATMWTATLLILISALAPSARGAEAANVQTRGYNCAPLASYAHSGGVTYVKMCSWLRVDYTNHRIRAYGMIQLSGAPATPRFGYLLLRRGGQVIRPGAVSASTSTYIQATTATLSCQKQERGYRSVSQWKVVFSGRTIPYAPVLSQPVTVTKCGW